VLESKKPYKRFVDLIDNEKTRHDCVLKEVALGHSLMTVLLIVKQVYVNLAIKIILPINLKYIPRTHNTSCFAPIVII